MAIIPQVSLFEYSDIEKLGDLERFHLALAGIGDEALMQRLEAMRGKGRNIYPIRVMWNLNIAMIVFGHASVESFRRELGRNSQLRKACGLYDDVERRHLVPPSRVFSGFTKMLKNEQEEINRIFEGQVNELYKLIPGFGEKAAGDGKYVDSIAKSKPKECDAEADNRRENDAKWSVKEYHYTDTNGNLRVKKEYHFGFKVHIICDVGSELPMLFSVTVANADEKKEMIELLKNPLLTDEARAGNIMKYLCLDRGYDSTDMITAIKGIGATPLVDIRNCWKIDGETKRYKDTNIVYTYKGDVYMMDENGQKEKMRYEGYDKQKKCLRYSHGGKFYKIYISYDERIFLPIARDSEKYKKLFNGRTSVERLNARLDRDYMFEDHNIRGLEKMKLMISLSMIIMNGMAIGKLKSGKTGIRSLKSVA